MSNKYEVLIKYINDGDMSFDTWGSKIRADIFNFLWGKELIEIENELYIVNCRKGGGAGMGAYPESVTLKKVCIEKLEK